MTSADLPSGLRRNTNWRYLWAGQAVSLIGDYVFDITIVLWVGTVVAAGRTWAPAAVSGVLIAAAAPVVLIGPLAGVYVDRWDRRRTMLVADLVRAALVAVLLVLSLNGHRLPVATQLEAIYGIVALISAAAQFFNPARVAIIASTVHPDDRSRAFSLAQASASMASVVGPPLAAPLLFSLGVQWALVVNAASFVVSFLAVRAIRVPRAASSPATQPGRYWTEFRAGLRFFGRSPLLVAIAVSISIATLGVGALNVLDVFFVTDNLHVAASWLGTLSAAFGLGSVAGALLAGFLAGRLGDGRVYWLGFIVTGVLVVIYSRMTWLPSAIVVLGLAGIPVSALSSVAGPLVLRATPENLVGRVMAVLNPVQQLASITAMAVAGFLASTVLRGMNVVVAGVHFGPIDTVFVFAGFLMIGAGLYVILPMRSAPARSVDPETAAGPVQVTS